MFQLNAYWVDSSYLTYVVMALHDKIKIKTRKFRKQFSFHSHCFPHSIHIINLTASRLARFDSSERENIEQFFMIIDRCYNKNWLWFVFDRNWLFMSCTTPPPPLIHLPSLNLQKNIVTARKLELDWRFEIFHVFHFFPLNLDPRDPLNHCYVLFSSWKIIMKLSRVLLISRLTVAASFFCILYEIRFITWKLTTVGIVISRLKCTILCSWKYQNDPIIRFDSRKHINFPLRSVSMHHKYHHPTRSDIDHNIEANNDENRAKEAAANNE